MANETARLAEYAASLRYEDLPPDVIARAKAAIADTVATIVCGADLPWSRMVTAYARRMGPGGRSRVLGVASAPLQAAPAALANGALAHAFELDNLTSPGAGVHPGATLLPPLLAVAQERGEASGRDVIAAFVAGAEVMIRIGRATKHTNEQRGFHAPGTTGPFGGAVALGRLLGFDAERMQNAMGIAGSLASGLMEFAKSGSGAMVKRLHLGRAAESGVLAAGLAAEGFTGPKSVLEGEFGFLRVFCREWEMEELTQGLGQHYATRSILMKRFPCHITAHTSVQAILDLQAEHGIAAADVTEIAIAGNEKMARVNNIPEPADLMMAQYSIPFCVALALHRDPRDPRSVDAAAVADPAIRALARRVRIAVAPGPHDHATLTAEVRVTLRDGRVLTRTVDRFKGTPEEPLDRIGLREKFLTLTGSCPKERSLAVIERIEHLEEERDLDWLELAPEAREAGAR